MLVSTSYLAHLSYCTNVHPGESWREVFSNLTHYLPQIKSRVSPEADLGVGLRLSAEAAADLQSGEALRDLQLWLHDNGFYVFTVNGFSYGRFHGGYVREQAFSPDWRSHERLTYAQREAVLAKLMALRDPVYLHQVVERKEDGTLCAHRDLTAAIVAGPGEGAREWRIHFHVPVFAPRYGVLASTHDETAQALQLCVSKYPIDHLEIETFTWEVLPHELRAELVDSITREFEWTRQQLRKE